MGNKEWKFVAIRHNHQLSESQIEDILIDNPYLLRENYESLKRQVKFRDKTRADIVFYGSPVLVVELKKTRLESEDVGQIAGYVRNLEAQGHKEVSGLLVGLDYSPELEKEVEGTDLPIEMKRLGIDIPTELQKCTRCDRFCGTDRKKCPHCGFRQLRYWDTAEGSLV